MIRNVFSLEKLPAQGEVFDTILRRKNIHIERIITVSSDPDKIYDQEQDELVIILEGEAHIEVKGKGVFLCKGDTLFIEAHSLHRVVSAKKGTIWLAVHIS